MTEPHQEVYHNEWSWFLMVVLLYVVAVAGVVAFVYGVTH